MIFIFDASPMVRFRSSGNLGLLCSFSQAISSFLKNHIQSQKLQKIKNKNRDRNSLINERKIAYELTKPSK
jgi:hypothetical protein